MVYGKTLGILPGDGVFEGPYSESKIPKVFQIGHSCSRRISRRTVTGTLGYVDT